MRFTPSERIHHERKERQKTALFYAGHSAIILMSIGWAVYSLFKQ